ncbi:hypothetical protein E4U40_005291 [Claviceps sp. LM458 group G5]|nr:hypothetical protein E4U40_005291 [Claviceps sp. LM458 group G5]
MLAEGTLVFAYVSALELGPNGRSSLVFVDDDCIISARSFKHYAKRLGICLVRFFYRFLGSEERPILSNWLVKSSISDLAVEVTGAGVDPEADELTLGLMIG